MKQWITIFTILFFGLSQLKALDVSVTPLSFQSGAKSYMEVHVHVIGNTATFATTDSLEFKAGMEVIMMFKQGEEVKNFEKYNLFSPVVKGKEGVLVDFADVKRFALPDGAYDLEISIKDLYKEGNNFSSLTPIVIRNETEKFKSSDIILLGAFRQEEGSTPFHKNGLYMEKLPFDFVPPEIVKLAFYMEFYNADKDPAMPYLVRYWIESAQQVKGRNARQWQIGNKKQKPDPLGAVLLQMDVSGIPSGNYNLVVEVRSGQNEVIHEQKAFFQRSNPYLEIAAEDYKTINADNTFVSALTDMDAIYCVKTLFVNLPSHDVQTVEAMVKAENADMCRKYLVSYWVTTSPEDPEGGFKRYMKRVSAANNSFRSSLGFGFQSDRGRIYLKYGPPNDRITQESDPKAPPYEIWTYYEFSETQKLVKFVFYNPTMAVGDFELLHSTARGEMQNPRWKRLLYGDTRQTEGNYFDDTDVMDDFGSHGGKLFDDF